MVPPRIPTLDMFSGIGGFSYALHPICQTVAYCEIEPNCHTVLRNNMSRGIIDKAPIIDDITKMDGSECPVKPRMCTMGFPCQDVSVLRNGKGLQGERSGLFKQAMRVIDTIPSINWILIENSPNIKNRGIHTVLRLLTKSGFQYKHSVFSAREVGAPHLRKRWVCLCWRGSPFPAVHADTLLHSSSVKSNWSRGEHEDRLVPRTKKSECGAACDKNITRCSLLGNSVVPQCIAHALCVLTGTKSPNASPHHHGPSPPGEDLVLRQGKLIIYRKPWITPCFSTRSWYVYNLSNRSANVLVNQLYYAQDTFTLLKQRRTAGNMWDANPRFIEWMMGYPPNYTRI